MRNWLHTTLVLLVLLFAVAPSQEAAIDAPGEATFVQADDVSDDRTDTATDASAHALPGHARRAPRGASPGQACEAATPASDAPFRPPKSA